MAYNKINNKTSPPHLLYLRCGDYFNHKYLHKTMRYNINETTHIFEKQNLMTIYIGKKHYDILKCKNCGITGKRINLNTVVSKAGKYCKNQQENHTVVDIKITKCAAVGKAFDNLLPNSIHKVISAPKGYKNGINGYWVMGVGEPVLVLHGEFEIIK